MGKISKYHLNGHERGLIIFISYSWGRAGGRINKGMGVATGLS